MKPLLRDVRFGNYDVLAPKGKSLAFTSSLAGRFFAVFLSAFISHNTSME